MKSNASEEQIACYKCLDHHLQKFQCQIRCMYCFQKHQKIKMVEGVCPKFYPYLNSFRQKSLCKVCQSSGKYNKVIELLANSQIQKNVLLQMLQKDQNVVELSHQSEVIQKDDYAQTVYKIRYKREQTIYECPYCLGQQEKQYFKYRYCCGGKCYKCKSFGLILNSSWQQPTSWMQQSKQSVLKATEQQIQKPFEEENIEQACEFKITQEQDLKKQDSQKQDQKNQDHQQVPSPKKLCRYCYGQHAQKDLKQKKLCPIVYHLCKKFRKIGTCKQCQGTGKKNTKTRIGQSFQQIQLFQDQKWKNIKIRISQKRIKPQKNCPYKVRCAFNEFKEYIANFEQAEYTKIFDRNSPLSVEYEYSQLELSQQCATDPWTGQIVDDSIQIWYGTVVYYGIYQNINENELCFECNGEKTAFKLKLCEKSCNNGCHHCNYKTVIQNKNWMKMQTQIQDKADCKFCFICKQVMECQKEALWKLKCKHQFHQQCLQIQRRRNYDRCPTCKKRLYKHVWDSGSDSNDQNY